MIQPPFFCPRCNAAVTRFTDIVLPVVVCRCGLCNWEQILPKPLRTVEEDGGEAQRRELLGKALRDTMGTGGPQFYLDREWHDPLLLARLVHLCAQMMTKGQENVVSVLREFYSPIPMKPSERVIYMEYKNWRDEVAIRIVTPTSFRFEHADQNPYHKDPGWRMDAMDLEKHAERTFDVYGILWWSLTPKTQTEKDSS